MVMSWMILLSIGGAFVIYKRTSFQRPHRIFTYALLFRAFFYVLSAFFVVHNYINNGFAEINGVLSVRKLISAFIFYIAFFLFPISVLRCSRGVYASHTIEHMTKRIVTFFTPAIVVSVGYFTLCSNLGVSPFEKYASLADIWINRANPVIMGRVAVYVVLSTYIGYLLYYMYQLEPIYTSYIKQTQSNENFNLSWMKGYFGCVSVVFFAYVIILLYVTTYSLPIYLVVAFLSYLPMIYYVVSCKSFAPLDGLKIRFTFLKPIVEVEDSVCKVVSSDVKEQFAQFEEWLNSVRPYTSSNFSLNDVLVEFPAMNYNDINVILQERGCKFQSYIRGCRIGYAMELIDESADKMSLKEISYKVGFDNPTSFSRAFKAVKGISPRDYRDTNRNIPMSNHIEAVQK